MSTTKEISLDEYKKRGLVLAIIRNKETHENVCMCYHEQVKAVAELMIGKDWDKTHEVVDSPPAIILSDVQVLLAMAPVMQVKMPRGGPVAGPGMFAPMRPTSPMQQYAGEGDDDDDDVYDDVDVDDISEDDDDDDDV
jgi:hypothetical protein